MADNFVTKLGELHSEITTKFDALATKVAAIETAAGRPGAGNVTASVDTKAFDSYLRNGVITPELKAMSAGVPSEGGYTVPKVIDSQIRSLVTDISPMRSVALFFLIGRRIVRLLVGLFDLVVRLEALGGERLGVFLIHAKLRELRHEIFFGDVAFGFGIGLHVRDTGLLVARKGDDADLHELGFGDRANTAFHGELDHPKADRETRHGTSLHGGVGVAPCCRVEKHAVGLQAVVVFLKLRPNADRHGPRIVVEEHGRDGPVGLVVRQRLGESAGGNDIARVVLIAEHCAIAGESLLRSLDTGLGKFDFKATRKRKPLHLLLHGLI